LERISGANNWKLVIRREAEQVTILQALTCDSRAALPEELFGLPVTVLGDHALTSNRTPPEGEAVLVTCGIPPEDGWDNRSLTELKLPDSLRRVENYALFNCTGLKTLILQDTAAHWGGGSLMNCRALDTFRITCTGQEGVLLAYLCDELIRELDVTLYRRDGTTARLIFPSYTEEHEENIPHHQFDFRISGGGYAYHHCFYEKKFSLKDYDDLWKPFLGVGHDPAGALRLAWRRLICPVELTHEAEEQYLAYIRAHAEALAHWLLAEGDASGLRALLHKTAWDSAGLSALSEEARRQGKTELMAILMEERHRNAPAGLQKSFDL